MSGKLSDAAQAAFRSLAVTAVNNDLRELICPAGVFEARIPEIHTLRRRVEEACQALHQIGRFAPVAEAASTEQSSIEPPKRIEDSALQDFLGGHRQVELLQKFIAALNEPEPRTELTLDELARILEVGPKTTWERVAEGIKRGFLVADAGVGNTDSSNQLRPSKAWLSAGAKTLFTDPEFAKLMQPLPPPVPEFARVLVYDDYHSMEWHDSLQRFAAVGITIEIVTHPHEATCRLEARPKPDWFLMNCNYERGHVPPDSFIREEVLPKGIRVGRFSSSPGTYREEFERKEIIGEFLVRRGEPPEKILKLLTAPAPERALNPDP